MLALIGVAMMGTHLYSTRQLDFNPQRPLHPSPVDWRDQVIYFLLIDRFQKHGDHAPPLRPGEAPARRDPAAGGRFQGGDLRGIIERLDYIQNLGCTAIWISPFVKNRIDRDDTYHGYGAQDFLQVDPRFGTLDDLRALTAAAHARGMYVIADIVLNHTGDVWSYPNGDRYYYDGGRRFPFGAFREHDPAPGFQLDDAVWPAELQDPEAFKRKGEIRRWEDAAEARDGDFSTLKELDVGRPEVLDALIKIYKYWIVAADLDAFRLDTVKHLESSAVAIFCNAIREYAREVGKHNFFLFGEIVGGDEVIERYLGRNTRIEGTSERFPSLDAALDFPLYFMLEEVLKGFRSPEELRLRYEELRTKYADHGEAGGYFVSFVENHDQMSRPYRRFLAGAPWQQGVQAAAFLLTSPGIPCLYYGSEQGLDGAGDSDAAVRECMFGGAWGAFGTAGAHVFDEQHPIYTGIRAIAQIRREQPALRYGRYYPREISGNGRDFGFPAAAPCTLAASRVLDADEVLVALGIGGAPRTDCVTVDANLSPPGRRMRNLLEPSTALEVRRAPDGRAYVELALPAYGVAILKCD